MRKGYEPAVLMDPKGDIFAIATGADATSEHEWGSDNLMTELTGQVPFKRADIARALRERKLKQVPDILDTRVIKLDLESIVFQKGEENGEPVAALGYTARFHPMDLLKHPELRFSAFSEPKHLAGAWDDSSFGFKVKGEKLVQRLERFYQAMMRGACMFAGLFLTDQPKQRLKGVIICNTELLRPEHRAAMKKAQASFEADVQLHLKARTDELQKKAAQVFKSNSRSFGHVWPAWKGEPGGDIVYGYNPGYGINQDLYGRYSFEELWHWLDTGATARIRTADVTSA